MGRYVEAEALLGSRTGFGKRTYRAYVPHSLARFDPVLSVGDVNAVRDADFALAKTAVLPHTELSGALAAWMKARDESIRSSVIEGVDATASGLTWAQYMNQAGQPVTDENEALTLGATKQVTTAVELGSAIRSGVACTTDDILELHRTLFAESRDRGIGGVLRDSPIWVGPAGCLIDNATFVAPPERFVAGLMEDLVGYLNNSDHPPVLKAAIMHAQFETIHPFADGNGRTGRALIHTVLNAAGSTVGALGVSTALSNDLDGYYQALNAVRVVCAQHDHAARSRGLRSWLRMFSLSCQQAHTEAVATAHDAETLTEHWLKIGRFRKDSTAAALLQALPTMPVLDAAMVSKRLNVSERVARDALKSLEIAGIVTRTEGKRNRRFVVPAMLDGTPTIERNVGETWVWPLRVRCDLVGPRSKKRCVLPRAHKGQHRY